MPTIRRILFAVVTLIGVSALVQLLRHPRFPGQPHASVLPLAGSAPAPGSARAISPTPNPAPLATALKSDTRTLLAQGDVDRLAYSQAWRQANMPPELAAFRAWVGRFQRADPAERTALTPEGVTLAQARRPAMHEMIKTEPQRALALTVPAAVRQVLPATVLAELETRVSGTGDLEVLAAAPREGSPADGPALERTVTISSAHYVAHVYGRRLHQLTKTGTSLHGIALDGDMALHESPLRVFEDGERSFGEVADAGSLNLGSSNGVSSGTPDTGGAFNFVEIGGQTWPLDTTEPDAVAPLEQRLIAAESQSGPHVRPMLEVIGADTKPMTAAEVGTSWTLGTKKILIIRVDFSDKPGEPVSVATAQDVMDNTVRPFLENISYGKTSLVTTVSTKLYRMPKTAAAYAVPNDSDGLHSDARAAAAADYDIASYDRVVVDFVDLSPPVIPGSTLKYTGLATLGGSKVWVSDTFRWSILAHELGHTYGAGHSEIWIVNDGDPLSPAGAVDDGNDLYDRMGSGKDLRCDFNHRLKNLLGWLPDGAVADVTTSGTYRLYRFDSVAASLSQPLALRIFRDATRWYWIGYRQNFASDIPASNGAYVLWAAPSDHNTILLDLNTPGNDIYDAMLQVGETLSDRTYGVTIKSVAREGNEPAQYLELEVKINDPPNIATSWGSSLSVPMGLVNVKAVAAGDYHALALKSDSTVVAWGNNTYGQASVPADLGKVSAIACGGNVSGAVKADGTVVLWGKTTNNVTTPPSGLTNVTQLAIGASHALARKADGTVVGWGDNSSGQITVPTGLTGVVAIAAGDRQSIALKSDGTVVRWGANFGTMPTGLKDVVSISCISSHVLALKRDGTVVAWGVNGTGQINVPAGLSDVVAVAAGSQHSLALKADGTVVVWGNSTDSRVAVPSALPRAFAITASSTASYAIIGSGVFITAQPTDQTATIGGNVVLQVAVDVTVSTSYQWRKNGVAIAGATASKLLLSGVAGADSGNYDVAITDGARTAISSAALVTVNPVSRITNLSILTPLTPGETMTLGTVLGGGGTSGTKPLVARAAGPSLAAFGVTGTLPDPTITLVSSANGANAAANDDWRGDATLSSAFAQVGAFGYSSPDSKDAGIFVRDLSAGSYTALVRDSGTGSGTVIAELYDATPNGAFIVTTPRLINVSVLKQLGAGDTMTAGFVIAGTSPKRMLIRAVGPALGVAPFSLVGVLADPRIYLYNGQSVIASNDNWGTPVGASAASTTQLGAAFTQVGAFALPTGSKDAALLVTLSSGNYTAQINGVNGASGLAIVEVYEVP